MSENQDIDITSLFFGLGKSLPYLNNNNKMRNIIVFNLLVVMFSGCLQNHKNASSVMPIAKIGHESVLLENETLKAVWSVQDSSIALKKVINKYNNEVVDLENITLFSLELEDGSRLSNYDFKLYENLTINNLIISDSLPTEALRFPGKEIVGNLIEKNGNISIRWSVQLREGSNYIRQNILIKSIHKPVEVRSITFYDGKLEGAIYAGSVLGSPIEYKSFFFGLEHPISQSKALFARDLGRGSVNSNAIDISEIVDRPGTYTIAVEHGGGPDNFNISSITLTENGKVISSDEHSLNGYGGSNFYQFQVNNYNPDNQYQIKANIINSENASGRFHIYRKTEGILNFFVKREDILNPGEFISAWSVTGVVMGNHKRRAFLQYLERERARPYKQFLHYNCWWDITGNGVASFTSEQLIERMHAWNQKFIEPYDIELKSFVFDDGWDDLDSVWYFDPIKFPEGFAPQAALCQEYNSGIGVWMSPFGGYGKNKIRRVASAGREGLETNDKGLSLAGINYYNRFLERSLDMLINYNVNYFKFDGFGGSNPKYLPDMEAGARLIKELRKQNPDVFINITVGSWPSPFWLQYADCTYRGSGDLHQAGKGSRTQKFITYRDGTLHNNVVKRAPYYPLNSIMTIGIAYANIGLPKNFVNDDIEDFKDMVRSFFASGSSLQELYISHDRMKEDFWPVLAEAAKWAKANEETLFDTHWIGGSPINLEVYGFASWTPDKGIIMLRNPSEKIIVYELNLNKTLELPENYKSDFKLQSPWQEDRVKPVLRVGNGELCRIELKPFETKVLEVTSLK